MLCGLYVYRYIIIHLATLRLPQFGPGGVLDLEKGTDCGLSAAELWLSRANNAKKGGLSSHYR